MACLDCTAEDCGGLTLVELSLESDAPERVTLERTHETPIWPPRRQGVPERGWAADGWTGIVRPGAPRSLGYATPGEPPAPPMRVSETDPEPATTAAAGPRDVLRALGDPRPPRDAVQPSAGGPSSGPDAAAPAESTDEPAPPEVGPLEPDLDAVAARLDRAEALAKISSVEEAGRVVDESGGIQAVRALVAQLERDRAALADLHERTAHLQDRAAVEVPVDDLARLV
jgi:hypothetical protein